MTQQTSLFDQSPPNQDGKTICFRPELNQWRKQARRALEEQLHPDAIHWCCDSKAADAPTASSIDVQVPKSYADAIQQAQWHSDPQRWDLFYRLLWRMHHGEKGLMQKRQDEHRQRLHRLVRQVNRDLHKMKAFVRFEPIKSDGEESFYAWFEPEHYILKPGAQFFRRRFSNMRWMIHTPEGIAIWVPGDGLRFSGPQQRQHTDDDPAQALWHRYYQSTFNPARLKIDAMLNEMPKKYWKNMPETRHITAMIHGSSERTGKMLQHRKSEEKLRCGPRPTPTDSKPAGEPAGEP